MEAKFEVCIVNYVCLLKYPRNPCLIALNVRAILCCNNDPNSSPKNGQGG